MTQWFCGGGFKKGIKYGESDEYVDEYLDNEPFYTQQLINHKNTDLAFSPNIVANVGFTFMPLKNFTIDWMSKYVGRQFLDNTSNSENNFLQLDNSINTSRSIKPYYILDARLNYTIETKVIPEIGFMLSVFNVLSTSYETNGYTFSYYTGPTLNTFNYLAPSSPIYFLAGFSLKF